jgi:hypothetical protein
MLPQAEGTEQGRTVHCGFQGTNPIADVLSNANRDLQASPSIHTKLVPTIWFLVKHSDKVIVEVLFRENPFSISDVLETNKLTKSLYLFRELFCHMSEP